MSIEIHNADFTSKRFLHDLGTSLNQIRAIVEVIFYVSLSLCLAVFPWPISLPNIEKNEEKK